MNYSVYTMQRSGYWIKYDYPVLNVNNAPAEVSVWVHKDWEHKFKPEKGLDIKTNIYIAEKILINGKIFKDNLVSIK